MGVSWEGFLIEAVIQQLGARADQCFFPGTHTGAELDLLLTDGPRRSGFEIQRSSAPTIARSMRTALDVVHAGEKTFPMARMARPLSAHDLLRELQPLRC